MPLFEDGHLQIYIVSRPEEMGRMARWVHLDPTLKLQDECICTSGEQPLPFFEVSEGGIKFWCVQPLLQQVTILKN
jgi:hypothetical protein